MGSSEGAPRLWRRDHAAACGAAARQRLSRPSSLSPRRGQSLPELPAGVTVARDERRGSRPTRRTCEPGLKALPATVEIAYVTSCDVPLLVPGFVRRMIDLLGDHDIAVMEVDGFPHPLSAVYRRDTLPQVEALLAARSTASGVPVRCGANPPRAASRDDLGRSRSGDAAQRQYARRVSGGALERRLADETQPR